jgi:hypothetical protein
MRLLSASILIAATIVAFSGRYNVILLREDRSYPTVLVVDSLFGRISVCKISDPEFEARRNCSDFIGFQNRESSDQKTSNSDEILSPYELQTENPIDFSDMIIRK